MSLACAILPPVSLTVPPCPVRLAALLHLPGARMTQDFNPIPADDRFADEPSPAPPEDASPADVALPATSSPEFLAEEEKAMAAIQRVLEGDTEAFAVILHTYERLVAAALARRLPAQDVQEVAQDTFLRAFRALPSFRHDSPVRSWLLKIARLAAMDHWRHHYRRHDIVMSDFDEAGAIGVEHAAQAVQDARSAEQRRRDDARLLLEAAMARLSPDDRAVLTLVELDNVPMAVAAEQLGCGLSAVKVRAFRARKRLKQHVEDILSQENATPSTPNAQ